MSNALAERLTLMKDFAAYKYAHGLPIRDEAREAAQLAGLEDALPADLDVEKRQLCMRFFKELMTASVDLQQTWTALWQQEGLPAQPVGEDMDALRRRVDTLNAQLLQELLRGALVQDTYWQAVRRCDCIDPSVVERLRMVYN